MTLADFWLTLRLLRSMPSFLRDPLSASDAGILSVERQPPEPTRNSKIHHLRQE